MDLFSAHTDHVLRQLYSQSSQGPAAQMVRGTGRFDPLRATTGYTLPKRGFSLPKSGGIALDSRRSRGLKRSVRDELQDMGNRERSVKKPRDLARDDADVLDSRQVAGRSTHMNCEAMNRPGKWISMVAGSLGMPLVDLVSNNLRTHICSHA